jgi:hypothetical protein
MRARESSMRSSAKKEGTLFIEPCIETHVTRAFVFLFFGFLGKRVLLIWIFVRQEKRSPLLLFMHASELLGADDGTP